MATALEANDKMYKIEYEELHMLCLKCGKFGHFKEACQIEDETIVPKPGNETQVKEEKDVESMWTVVQKNRPNPKKKPTGTKPNVTKPVNKGNGSRFNVLHTESEDVGNQTGSATGNKGQQESNKPKEQMASNAQMEEDTFVIKENTLATEQEKLLHNTDKPQGKDITDATMVNNVEQSEVMVFGKNSTADKDK